jgi:tetraacyldisaccharide 4'-kinase
MNNAWLRGVWERRGISGKLFWLLLLPASWLYRLIVQARNAIYSHRWIRKNTLEKPVISIGNLTVGGTGKTPSCLWLAQELTNRGYAVAVLSRGYRRKNSQTVILNPKRDSSMGASRGVDVTVSGDEPLMIARLYGHLVGIGKNRYQTGRELLSREHVDVFLLDDGYQHRQLFRDVDLLLLGQEWAGQILPAGPFREPRGSLRRAHYYLVTGAPEKWQSLVPFDAKDRCFVGSLKSVALVGVGSNQTKEFPLSLLYRSKILTVTGIADASGFYRMIHEWEGDIVETLEFPDHHHYSASDWQHISRLSRHVDFVITTEKDILKLAHFPFAKDKLLALRVAMTVENGDSLVQAVVQKIKNKPDHASPFQ